MKKISLKHLFYLMVVEILLFLICSYFQPDLIISKNGKILNSIERIEAFKDAFSYTLPLHLIMIFYLLKNIKIEKTPEEEISRSAIKSVAYSVAGIFLIIVIYLSNSF